MRESSRVHITNSVNYLGSEEVAYLGTRNPSLQTLFKYL
jgi:hypothetical protein